MIHPCRSCFAATQIISTKFRGLRGGSDSDERNRRSANARATADPICWRYTHMRAEIWNAPALVGATSSEIACAASGVGVGRARRLQRLAMTLFRPLSFSGQVEVVASRPRGVVGRQTSAVLYGSLSCSRCEQRRYAALPSVAGIAT